MTPARAAELMRLMLFDYLQSDGCATEDAPYWDDADAGDADDDAPLGTFPWYEEAADFVVTAFLATSFEPSAAIQFVTTARKLRLAFRTRNYGAIVRVLLGGVLQGDVDTYSAAPGITYLDVIVPAGNPVDNLLRLEHTGTHNAAATPTADGYGMEVIRKRLSDHDMGIQDVQLTGGQIQVKRTIGGAWENIVGGEVVRRDATLNPDIQSVGNASFTVNGGSIDHRYSTTGAWNRISGVSGQTIIGRDIGGYDQQLFLGDTSPNYSIKTDATALSTVLELFYQRMTSTTLRNAAALRAGWLASTDAVRRGYVDIIARDATAERRGIRVGTDGAAPTLGVLGADGIARPTLSGGDGGNVALRNLIDYLTSYGFVVDATIEETAEPVFVDFTDDQRCRVAYGVAFLWREHAQSFRDALEANAATLDAINPSTYDPVMAAFPPGYTNYNDARQWLIDRTVDWSTDTTPPPSTFAGWLGSLANWLDIELINIQCALYRVIPPAAYLSETVIDDWRDELAITIPAPLDAVTYFFQGLMDFTNRVSMGALVNAATALGVDSWDCVDCLPGSLEFSFESAASNTLEGATVKLYVVMSASAGGAIGAAITVNVNVTGGSAVAADYTVTTPVLTFPAGSTNGARQLFEMTIAADADNPDNDTIILNLAPSAGAAGATSQHTLTILPGGIARAWSQSYTINTANGALGWTITYGSIEATGLRTTGSAQPYISQVSRSVSIPHSSTMTLARFRTSWDFTGGGRYCFISINGDVWDAPNDQAFPISGQPLTYNGAQLPATLTDLAIICYLQAGQQYGYLGIIEFFGTGINPFTGV